ncbi:hypothetical protein ACAW74_24615 [Fibrella sp. WM1]|uniref:carboxylesterase family protein n=1 Tax=Fibrella musci TaxID=3242485 RepID=UPI0035210054
MYTRTLVSTILIGLAVGASKAQPLTLAQFLPKKQLVATSVKGLIKPDRQLDSLTLATTLTQLATQGGGVLIFDKGTYYINHDVILPDGVVLRGALPLSRTKAGVAVPVTQFEFPRFDAGASATPTSVADFKTAQPKRIYTPRATQKVGLLYLSINRAVVDLADVVRGGNVKHGQVWLQGLTLNNGLTLDPAVPSAYQRQHDHGWQRWGRRDVPNLAVGVQTFCQITDCRINTEPTDGYVQNSYMTNDGMLFDGTQARLLVTDHPAIAVYTAAPTRKSTLRISTNQVATAATAQSILIDGQPIRGVQNQLTQLPNGNWTADGLQALDKRYEVLYTDQYPSEAGGYVHATGDTLRYRLIQPKRMEPSQTYPVILYLHDYFEAGNDNRLQLRQFVWQLVDPAVQAKYPCFVVAPQLPATEGNWRSEAFSSLTWPLESSMQLIDSLARQYPIDRSRIYVVGTNMGGEGAYALATWYPDQLAAIVPVSTAYRLSQFSAQEAAKVPTWQVFGERDEWFGSFTRQLMRSYYRLVDRPSHFSEIKQRGHRCWNTLLAEEPTLLPWLFSQRKQKQ